MRFGRANAVWIVGNTGYVRLMYQMICPVLEVIRTMEGLDALDGAGTGTETDEV